MLQSMTGYGECSFQNVRCEIKTLNHRFFDANIYLPSCLSCYEIRLRQILRKHVVRGMVYFKIFIDSPEIKLDLKQARSQYKFIRDLQKNLKLNSDIPLELFLPFKKEVAPKWLLVYKVVMSAIKSLIKSRIEEGKKIVKDFESHLNKIDRLFYAIEKIAPKLESKRLEESSINSEVGKEDFSEERIRFEMHLRAFRRNICSKSASGKYSVFLLQEMQRECNTIASKAKDSRVAKTVVKLKEEIEKIREQAENVR